MRLSVILSRAAAGEGGERVSIDGLVGMMQNRAVPALMFVLAAPNMIPTPPGVSLVFGLPLLILSVQLLLNRTPSLPGFLGRRSVERATLERILRRIGPSIERVEAILRPRLAAFVNRRAQGLIGALCFFLTLLLFLPVPLGSMLPSLAICLLTLGLFEQDGLLVIAGGFVALAALLVVLAVLYGVMMGANLIVGLF